MAFKGEIPVGTLNTMFKTGFTVNDIYRVQGSGNLVPNNFAVTNGDFVKWTADGWTKSDTKYVTDTEVSATIYTDAGRFIKAKGATGGMFYPDDDPSNYHLGSIILLDNVLMKLTSEAEQDDEGEYFFVYNTTDLINIVMELEDRIHALEVANA